jgi:ubiquinol-cytochrome c reductase iron-sulfur subunit
MRLGTTMTIAPVDHDRRQFLVKSTATLAVVGMATTAVPFLASWQPTPATKLAGVPARIDLAKMAIGEGVKFLWRGAPMWVIRRDPAMIDQLDSLRAKLKDPDSLESQQPPYAHNSQRARRADVMVLTAICTHLGCIPELKGAGDSDLGADLNGGFFCACHGSRYDGAGRVLKGSPASGNMAVPPYYFANEMVVVIGVDAA